MTTGKKQTEEALLRLAEYALQMNTAIRETARDLDLNPDAVSNAGMSVLIRAGNGDLLRPGDVQEITGLSSGGVTKLLDRLQDAGYITRRYGEIEGDARGVSIHLTKAGTRVVEKVASLFEDRLGEFEVVTKELAQVFDEVE